MSHTTTIGKTTFIHNGGYDGKVHISCGTDGMDIEFEDLLGFVMQSLVAEKISRFEQADGEKLKEMIINNL